MTNSLKDVEKGTQMYKREITYDDLDGNEVTDTFYFNLNKLELMELGAEFDGGFESVLKRIVETKDQKALIEQFRKIIDASFGIKGEDNKQFIKGGEGLKAFQNTEAYSVLFMELATDDVKGAEFVNGTFPKDISEAVQKEMAKVPDFAMNTGIAPYPIAPQAPAYPPPPKA
jgi:hypothetical protein